MRIGRYEVLGEIARGGFGVVLRGRDQAIGRDVAIKILLRADRMGDQQRRRFEREVNALARLRHPNIVSVHEAGTCPQGPYVVMDLIEGESLERHLARQGPLPLRKALHVMEVVAGAIAHAHEQGVLHRDLKPANILVDPLGNPFVTDFGLARDIDPRVSAEALSRTGAALGTPGFWPPEQAFGDLERIGPRSDVYGLGATLYALLTDHAPYEGDNLLEVLGLMSRPPPPASSLRPGLPGAVDELLARALASNPEDRFASVAELGAALTDVRRRAAASGSLATGPAPRRSGARRALLATSAVTLAVVAAAATLVLRWTPPSAATSTATAPSPAAASGPPLAPLTPLAPATRTTSTPAPTEASAPEVAAAMEVEALVTKALAEAEALLAEDRPDTAVLALKPALERRPADPRLVRMRARVCVAGGVYAQAEADASWLIDADPDDLDARLIRGRAWRGLGDPANVLVDAGHVLALEPERAEAFALRAWASQKLGDVQQAFEDWTRAIAIEPRPEWLVDVGNLAFDQGQLDIAERDFSLALELDPGDLLALLNRAAVHTKREDLPRALADLDRAVAVRPDLAVVWSRRADVRRLLGQLDAALSDATHSLELDRDSVEAWRVSALTRSALGDSRGAIADTREAIARAPERADLYNFLGGELNRAGERERAFEADAEALRLDRDYARAYAGRGVVHEDAGDPDRALADYDRAIELDPDYLEARYNRALLRNKRQDHAGARADFDRVLELDPQYAECWITRGDLRRRTGDLEGAVADTGRALELAPDHPKAWLAAALARHEKGGPENLRAAAGLYTRYLEHDVTNGRIVVERGRCHEALGDKTAAIADYRRALELVPPGGDNVHAYARNRIAALERALSRPPAPATDR